MQRTLSQSQSQSQSPDLGQSQPQSQFQSQSSQWQWSIDDKDRSRDSSIQLISPVGLTDVVSAATDSFMFGVNDPTYTGLYGYTNRPSSSSSTTNQFGSGMGFQSETPYAIGGGPDVGYENSLKDSYDNDSNDLLSAAHRMFGFNPLNGTSTNTDTCTTITPQALFHSGIQNIPIDTARSPSPLNEISPEPNDDDAEEAIDESSSPELTEIPLPLRRSSESTHNTPARRGHSRSLSHSVSGSSTGQASLLEGLNKGDKRRMQNKLAQRAFRARSKITTKHAAGRLEHLEELTELQAGRIGSLTELIVRLQKENYALKSAKFQEAMMRGSI